MTMNFDEIEFAENTDPRCPTILILDCSDSMTEPIPGESRTPLEALNGGLDVLITELHKDPLAKRRVELSFVAFGSEVSPATEFTTIDNVVLPTLVPSGVTSMGKAIEVALDAVEERKNTYKANGISYYRPIVLLISDGFATDSKESAAQRIKEFEDRGAISFFAVGVEGADVEYLNTITNKREALMLSGLKFEELFQWLSASQASVSASNPGDQVPLPSPQGWAEL